MMTDVQISLVLLIPLFVGFLGSQVLKMPLKGLTGIYLLLSVANVILSYFLIGDWLTPLIIAAVGLLIGVVATGFFFEKLSPSDFAMIMAGVGMFPWARWDLMIAIGYAVVLAILIVIVALKPKFKNPLKKKF